MQMTTDALAKLLTLHAHWLRGEAGGVRADLTYANLTLADLTRANLTRANLTGANLTDANLTGANLTDSDLTGAIVRLTKQIVIAAVACYLR
jgi:uncharacterized protein YjbI with pentapeptide repeats